MSDDVMEFDALFGGGFSAAFPSIGTVVTGQILEPPVDRQQTDFQTKELKFWKDGKPMMNTIFRIQTDERISDAEAEEKGVDASIDDGIRSLFAKNQMLSVIKTAIRKSGAKNRKQLVGATLTVKYIKNERSQVGGSPKKIYEADLVLGTLPINDDEAFE